MKKLALLAALVSSLSFAQEIGTEISPTTPTSGAGTQPQQTQQPQQTPPPENKGGYVYKPKGAKEKEEAAAASAPTFTGTKVSAASGDFGIRAGFGTTASFDPTAPATSAAPLIGISYMGSDGFKLLLDVGFGLGIAGSAMSYSVGANVGFDYLFRTPGEALRPFFHFSGQFGMSARGSNDPDFTFGAQLGFGAEYFLNPGFSINGRLILAVPMKLAQGSFTMQLFTLTPGVGATWYF